MEKIVQKHKSLKRVKTQTTREMFCNEIGIHAKKFHFVMAKEILEKCIFCFYFLLKYGLSGY